MTDELRKRRLQATALETEGKAWDVGWGAFLAREEARYAVYELVLSVEGSLLVRRQDLG